MSTQESATDSAIVLPDSSEMIVSCSPHIHAPGASNSVRRIMYCVCLALLPGCAAGVYYFGFPALRTLIISVVSCLFFEWIWGVFKRDGKLTITDGSALVTALLLAMNLDAQIAWYWVVLGALVAIWLAKMIYGGLGFNPFNPALTARVFLLLACTGSMTQFVKPRFDTAQSAFFDPVFQSTATPLNLTHAVTPEVMKESLAALDPFPYWDFMIGNMPGCLGETSALALLVGGLFLIALKIIKWQIPLAYLGTIAVFTGIVHAVNPALTPDPLFHLLTGGVMLGAFFMITDMTTTPMTTTGGIIFAVGAGVITVVIRIWGAYPEGCSFSILLMNALTPLIDRYTVPKPFGERKLIPSTTKGGAL